MLNFSQNNIDPLHTNLQKGKDMTDAQAHVLEKEYKDMKISYHMALDKMESLMLDIKKLRAENMELKYHKKPSEAA